MYPKRLFPLLFLLPGLVAPAQTAEWKAPDYNRIERRIADKKSALHYPKLMARYVRGDTTLTLDEKRHLYYGFTFQPAYGPYGGSSYADSLRAILKKDSLETDDFFRMIVCSDSVLATNPFDLRTLYYRRLAFRELDITGDAATAGTRIDIILDAIMSSGSGLTMKNAFFVIEVPHEYVLLQVLGLEFGGEQKLIDHYDFLAVGKNDQGIEGLYFDITPCLKRLENLFKDIR